MPMYPCMPPPPCDHATTHLQYSCSIPYGFVKPLDLKLFFGRASRLRHQYLLMDVLLADHVVGELNGALLFSASFLEILMTAHSLLRGS